MNIKKIIDELIGMSYKCIRIEDVVIVKLKPFITTEYVFHVFIRVDKQTMIIREITYEPYMNDIDQIKREYLAKLKGIYNQYKYNPKGGNVYNRACCNLCNDSIIQHYRDYYCSNPKCENHTKKKNINHLNEIADFFHGERTEGDEDRMHWKYYF